MDTAAIRTEWVGRVIDGRFTLLQWLGGSESGAVFLTELHGPPAQPASIKLMPADSPEAEAHEAAWAITTTLSHPHLMRLVHTGRCEVDNVPLLYAVTEYSEEVLSQILPERPLTLSEAREMLDPVLDAMSYLHGKGIVHGHLKPSNILVVDNQLKLSSDSLHVAGTARTLSQAASVYDAPETATSPISPAADLWSLGVTLIEALSQHPPVWDRSSDKDPVVPEFIPQPFAGIVRECLRSDPVRRATLSGVRAGLQPAPSVPEPAIQPRKVVQTGRALPAKFRGGALVAALVVLAVIVAGLMLRSRSVEPRVQSGDAPAALVPKPSPASPTPRARIPQAPQQESAVRQDASTDQVLPDVLPSAQASINGQVNVSVRVTVDPAGNVSDATLDSPGPSKYFSKVALQAAQRWRFKPAQENGQAVSSEWILHFHFTRTATNVTPMEVTR